MANSKFNIKLDSNENEPSKNTRTLHSLSELSILNAEQTSPNSYKDRFNNTYDLAALMMYLLGIDEKYFENHDPNLMEEFHRYENDQRARTMRNLCMVRTALEKNFSVIQREFYSDLKNLSSLPEYIPTQAVMELQEARINIQKTKPDIVQYIITINKEISNRVNNLESLFPDWIKWDYIKPLFLMPDGMRPEGVIAAGRYYNTDRNRYPFQCYMNWDMDGCGNIFSSDYKFVTKLYEKYEDTFEDLSLVTAAGNALLGDLHEFLENHDRILIVVDCENSDPIKLSAAMLTLRPEERQKVYKIMFFDSDYTTPVWDTLCNTGITQSFDSEHIIVDRLYEHKSQADMTLAADTARKVLTENVDAVILVSSDSDYWALIKSLPEADFLVMLEAMKSGRTITNALKSKDCLYCYIDDFCTGTAYTIKTKTITSMLQEKVNNIVDFNIKELLDDVLQSAWLDMSEKEKKIFYDRYLKTMRLEIEDNGNVKLTIDS